MSGKKEKPTKSKRGSHKAAPAGKELTTSGTDPAAARSKDPHGNQDAKPSFTRFAPGAGFTEAKFRNWLPPDIGSSSDKEIWLVQLPSEWDPAMATELTITDETPGRLTGNFNTTDGDVYSIREEHDVTRSQMYAVPGPSGGPAVPFDRRITFSRMPPADAGLTALAEQIVAPPLEVQAQVQQERQTLTGPAAGTEIKEERYGPDSTMAREVAYVPATSPSPAAKKKKRTTEDKHPSSSHKEKKKKKKIKHKDV